MQTHFAFVFPGQGSQSIGMLADLAANYAMVSETFQTASAILGYDLWQLVQNGPEDTLNQTEYTQPAMLAAGVATWQVFNQVCELRPVLLAGHSLGEYSAMVCSGALDFISALKLVQARAQFMQQAVPAENSGVAAIIGLSDEKVANICVTAAEGEIVTPVNFNAIEQVVIAGHRNAVLRAIKLAEAEGARMAKLINVSAPVHCSLMQGASDKLRVVLSQTSFSMPAIPVINNADVKISQNVEQLRDSLARQVCSPVRWVETIQAMEAKGIQYVVECGPGKVLSKLNPRITRNMKALAIVDCASLDAVVKSLKETV